MLSSVFRQAIRGKPSLEDDATGQMKGEIEHVFYARLSDFKQLGKAVAREMQRQWEIKIPLSEKNGAQGGQRVRHSVYLNERRQAEYTDTTKVRLNQNGDAIECGIPSTDERFALFMLLAEGGMNKIRYSFPDPESDLVWEVDMFLRPDGGFYEWCKVDLEVPNRQTPIPAFPLQFEELIKGTHGERTDSEKAKVTELYEKYFLTKNYFRGQTGVTLEQVKELASKQFADMFACLLDTEAHLSVVQAHLGKEGPINWPGAANQPLANDGVDVQVQASAQQTAEQVAMAGGAALAMEGLGDVFSRIKNAIQGKDAKGVKASDAKPGSKLDHEGSRWLPEGQKAIQELHEAIDKYYLNPTWIDKQTFVAEPVKASDFSQAFAINDRASPDPFAAIEEGVRKNNTFIEQWNKVLGETDAQVQKVDAALGKALKAAKDEEAKHALVKKAVKDLQAIPYPTARLPKIQGTLLGNVVPSVDQNDWVTTVSKKTPTPVDTLPALDAAGVKRAAEIIKQLLVTDDNNFVKGTAYFNWLDHSDGGDVAEFVDGSNADQDEYYELYYHQTPEQMWYFDFGAFDVVQVAAALEKWIDRSIQGKTA